MARRYASRRRYASSGGSRRKLVWARTANLSPGQTTRSYDLLAPWRNAMDWGSTPGTTIRRIRMDVYAQTSSPVGEFINNMPILGIIVWSQDTNQADLLDPPDLEGRASDWMHWGQYSPYSQGAECFLRGGCEESAEARGDAADVLARAGHGRHAR